MNMSVKNKLKGLGQIHQGIMTTVGNRKEQAVNAIRAVKNLSVAAKAGKEGRAADRKTALADAAKAAKEYLIDNHPVTRTIKGVKRIVSGLKNLFNHPDWYNNYPLDGLVNLNYGRKKGQLESALHPVYKSWDSSSPTVVVGKGTVQYGVGNIWSFDTRLVTPVGASGHASWIQAIRDIYQTIRSANSGAVNYSVGQLERYILSVRAMRAILGDMRRTYQTLKAISLTDTTTPVSYFAGLGKDFLTFFENAADLREQYILATTRVNRSAPIACNLMDRTDWMFSNLFADSDDAKASVYAFALKWVRFFPSDLNNTGTDYQFGNFAMSSSSTGLVYGTYINNVRDFINAFVSDFTFGIIAGDILKAFGESALYKVDIISENESVPIIYDEAALTQIQNAQVLGGHSTNITQGSDGFINYSIYHGGNQHQGVIKAELNAMTQVSYVNAFKNSMSPAETISATRLCANRTWIQDPNTNTSDNARWDLDTCGTEIIGQQQVFYVSSGTTNNYGGININQGIDPFIMIPTNFSNILNPNGGWDTYTRSPHTFWAQFDYAPMLIDGRIYDFGTLPGITYAYQVSSIDTILWDFNNYAVAPSEQVDDMHGYAVSSLLAVPRLLKQSNAEVIG